MGNIDLRDRKILYELDTDSRQSFNEIARKAGLSKDSVINRIGKLKESGIISRFHTVIDTGKLGFISFRLYIKLQNTTPQKELEIIDFLKKRQEITWLVSIDGEYDLGMWVPSKSIQEMNALWKDLLHRYVHYISRRSLTILTKVCYFPRAYLLDKESNEDEFVIITEPGIPDIDDTDLEILKLMAPDSRIPVLEIAHKLGMTPKTASSRIRLLEKKRIIVGYRTMFNLDKLGYQYFKLHLNLHNVSDENISQFRYYVRRHPNMIYDNEVLGGDDFEIEIQAASLQDFRAILADLKSRFSDILKEYKHMNFYKEHKFLFFPVQT